MVKAFSLVEEALLVFESQALNLEWYAVLQNAVQCYCVMYDEKKELLLMHHWVTFFKTVDRIESQGTCATNISHKQTCTLPVVSCC